MSHEQERGRSRIPQFASREEAAEWFDTHDMADYWDEFEPVEMEVAKPLSHGIIIELDSETFRALTALARRKRVNRINMAKSWVLSRLKEELG